MRGAIPPRPNLREHVYQALKRAILQGELPGEARTALREEVLARSLGVSRTPVREALSRLTQEGLVTLERYRGARVVPRSLGEYLRMLEVREVLEGLGARLAAKRMDAGMLARLRAVFDGFTPQETITRAEEYAVANVRFHSLIVEASGNPVLARILRGLYDHMYATRFRVIERLGRGPESLAEHLQLIAALERRDPRRSELLARRHIRALRLATERGLESMEPSSNSGVDRERP